MSSDGPITVLYTGQLPLMFTFNRLREIEAIYKDQAQQSATKPDSEGRNLSFTKHRHSQAIRRSF